ncbi:hypothetical protein CSW67_27115, partial [Shigella boydii]
MVELLARGCSALGDPCPDLCSWLGPAPRAWAPAHSPSSGQAAPEPRPAGGAERPAWKPSEQQAGRRASWKEEEAAQPRAAQALLG